MRHELWNQVLGRASVDQAWDHVFNKVSRKVLDRVGRQVWSNVRDQVWYHVIDYPKETRL